MRPRGTGGRGFRCPAARGGAGGRARGRGTCSHAAQTLAEAVTTFESAKFSGHDPDACLAEILARIADHKIKRLDELLPWNWVPLAQAAKAVA